MDKNDREKNIDSFVDGIKSQKEWKNNLKEKIKILKKKFKDELNEYDSVIGVKNLYKLKLGGYIRYVNFNNELRWGGILLKIYKDKVTDRNILVLGNSNFRRNILSYENNYIFYKGHTTQSDKTRKLFISFLEKYKDLE
tara:strand:- start:614 stop:1030 length:417 start_codon:yes stop_codon:yes gene_type:complete